MVGAIPPKQRDASFTTHLPSSGSSTTRMPPVTMEMSSSLLRACDSKHVRNTSRITSRIKDRVEFHQYDANSLPILRLDAILPPRRAAEITLSSKRTHCWGPYPDDVITTTHEKQERHVQLAPSIKPTIRCTIGRRHLEKSKNTAAF